jgi:hypothetical protein
VGSSAVYGADGPVPLLDGGGAAAAEIII